MYKPLVIASLFALAVQACDSDSDDPTLAAALDDGQNNRLVTAYLQATPDSGFIPTYVDRVVVVQAMKLVTKSRAEGKTVYENINAVIIGESCEQLRANHTGLTSCEQVEAVDFEFGEVEFTTTTDAEGFAALYLGAHDKYRVTVNSWPTEEDDKCYWGGSEIVEKSTGSVAIPMLVFCE